MSNCALCCAALRCAAVLCCALLCSAVLCCGACSEFNNLWLLRHPEVHTLVVGAARPGDFDEHMHSISRIAETEALIPPIEARLLGLLEEAHGKEWLGAQGWSVGLPDTWGMIDGEGDERCVENNPKLVNFNLIIWLWTLAKAFDMVQFGRYRCE